MDNPVDIFNHCQRLLNSILIATYLRNVNEYKECVEEIREEIEKSPSKYEGHELPEYNKLIRHRMTIKLKTDYSSEIIDSRDYLIAVAFKKGYHNNRLDIEDLVSETILKGIKYQSSYSSKKGKIVTWLTNIMRNHYIDQYRKAKKMRFSDQEAEDYKDVFVADGDMEQSMDIDILLNAFHILSDIEQKMLNKVLEGYKYEEIADDLNVPIGTLKGNIFRAKDKLRNHFQVNQAA